MKTNIAPGISHRNTLIYISQTLHRLRSMPKPGRCWKARQQSRRVQKSVSHSHLNIFVDLKRWMQNVSNRQAVQSCKLLEPASFEETGRGLRTNNKLIPGDKIVSIPAQCLITVDTALESPVGFVLCSSGEKLTPQQLLSLFLAVESDKGDKSAWSPYIRSLPSLYTNIINFSRTELSLLTPHVRQLANDAVNRFQIATRNIMCFVKNFAPEYLPSLSSETLKWAWSTVNTRSVYLETSPHPALDLQQEESNVALAPFLDLLNHTDSAEITAGLSSDGSCYDILTYDTYKKYDQVFICYGAHDDVKLMVDYGFTLPSNINNTFSFTIDDIVSILPQKMTKGELDRKHKIVVESQLSKKLVCSMEGCSWALSTALKIYSLPWDLLPQWKLLIQGQTVSEDNDGAGHDLAVSLLTHALGTSRSHLTCVLGHETEPRSTHFDMIVSLAQADVLMLEASINILK